MARATPCTAQRTVSASPPASRAARIADRASAGAAGSSRASRAASPGGSATPSRAEASSHSLSRTWGGGMRSSMQQAMRRSTAGPKLTRSFAVQITGAGAVSSRRWMKARLPGRGVRRANSKPESNRSSASSSSSRAGGPPPTSRCASLSAARRSARASSSASSPSVAISCSGAPQASAKAAAKAVLPVPGGPWSSTCTPGARSASAPRSRARTRPASAPR